MLMFQNKKYVHHNVLFSNDNQLERVWGFLFFKIPMLSQEESALCVGVIHKGCVYENDSMPCFVSFYLLIGVGSMLKHWMWECDSMKETRYIWIISHKLCEMLYFMIIVAVYILYIYYHESLSQMLYSSVDEVRFFFLSWIECIFNGGNYQSGVFQNVCERHTW